MHQIHKTFLQLHRLAWVVLLFHALFLIFTRISFIPDITFGVKMLLCLSGAVLFFFYFKPFKQIAFYYAIYVFTPLLVWLSWLIDGIMFALVSTIPLLFISPNEVVFEEGDYTVYQRFNGFLAPCCSYEVVENRFYLFEKSVGGIKYEGDIDFDKAKMEIDGKKVSLMFDYEYYDYNKKQEIKKDTTIFIGTK